MAGDKGKGKRPSVAAEHRGGEERGPKVRKVTQEEIKERDKPMKEQGRKFAPVEMGKKVAEEDWQSFANRMTERQVDFYKSVVEEDFEYLFWPEELMPYHPGGVGAAKKLDAFMRKQVKNLKEHASQRLEEYNLKGSLEGIPPTGKPSDVIKRLLSGK